MKNGRAGERYIIGGENATFNRFMEIVSEVSNVYTGLIKIPLWMLNSFAWYSDTMAKFNIEPRATRAWVKKYRANWTTSTEKAERELGYKPRTLKQGLTETIAWLQQLGK
jgi:farnesol dehydrogenase